MPQKHARMRLSREEETFLRHWIYDEAHYQEGTSPAKRLQLQHRATPADVAILIAAGFPDAADQEAASLIAPSDQSLTWPWLEETFRSRVAEARSFLAERQGSQADLTAHDL